MFSCTYTNTKLGNIIIKKVTDPVGGTGFGFTDNIEAPNSFTLDHGEMKTFLDVTAGTYTVTENDPTPGYDLVNLVCTDDFDQNGYNVVDSSVDLVNREATINVDPGETVECTYTNRQRGMVDLLKLTNGLQDPIMMWSFTLKGPEVNVGDSTPPALMDFGGAKLIPGQTYTMCETGIPPSWTIQWAVDANGNDVIDMDETLPFVGDPNMAGLLQVYDPAWNDPNPVNDTRCLDFQVGAAETLSFIVDNQRPGGDPRTPGYWKNWNTCSNGNQDQTAFNNGGSPEGWFLLDDLIPTTVGSLDIASCEDGVLILDHRELGGKNKKRASDAAYNLARNLLAAKLNLAAGAETCNGEPAATIALGDALLMSIGFDGTGGYLKGKNAGDDRAAANALATTLDEYNNGRLCQ
ncbi:MAG: prealbumin-like fold domain-containing protein [Gammaproteobacteria bacterium]